MKGHTTQNTTNTATYGQITPNDTPDIQAYRTHEFQTDPSIPYRYQAARTRLRDSFNNPIGAYTTADVREKTERAGDMELTQQEGEASQESNFANQALEAGRLSDLAGLTAPRIVQTGGTQNSTVTQPFNWGSVISGAAGIGAAAL